MKRELIFIAALCMSTNAVAKIDFLSVAGEATKVAVSAYEDWNAKSNSKATIKQTDFYNSKVWLKKITQNHPYTFYSDCKISFSGKKKSKLTVSPQSCGLDVYKSANRASRGEAEHIVPASWYGKSLSCWKNGGRSNCQKVSEKFNDMEGDLINLQYTVGSLNADRSNYKFGEFGDSGRVHDYTGEGDVMFDDYNNLFEPPESKKGWIGRVHLYMVDKYGVKLNRNYSSMISRWSQLPATQWECEYNRHVQNEWGYSNKYTTAVCG